MKTTTYRSVAGLLAGSFLVVALIEGPLSTGILLQEQELTRNPIAPALHVAPSSEDRIRTIVREETQDVAKKGDLKEQMRDVVKKDDLRPLMQQIEKIGRLPVHKP